MLRTLFTLYYNVIILAHVVVALDALEPSLLWGPYRSNLYFGLRPRIPKSLSLGLMWSSNDGVVIDKTNIRHTCEQNDGLTNYGWSTYDVRTGGIQTISDPKSHLNLTTNFVKFSKDGYEGSWGVRIQGNPEGKSTNTVLFYLALENEERPGDSRVACEKKAESESNFDINCKGVTPSLMSFNIQMTAPNCLGHCVTTISSMKVPDDDLWKVKCK
jgi:mannosyl-oligosaccharide glucosidase